MKLLKSVSTMRDAQLLSDQLKSKGIVTYLLSDETAKVVPLKRPLGIVTVGVWVVFDYQFEDAVKLMANPDHIVARALTPDEMKLLVRNQRPPYSVATRNIIKWTIKVFVVVVIICIIGYFLRISR
jgi:hypothetical protein